MAKKPVDKFSAFTAATTDTTVHTVSANRKLTLTDIIVTNKESGAVVVTLWDGPSTLGQKKLELEVAATDSLVIKGLSNGVSFRTSVTAQVSSFTNGSSIWVGGYEE